MSSPNINPLFLFIQVDPVTKGIELTVHYFNLEFDVQFWSQYVSFILIGIIVVTSIRGLLITLTKVTRRTACIIFLEDTIRLLSLS